MSHIERMMKLREQLAKVLFNKPDGATLTHEAELIIAQYVLAAAMQDLVDSTDRLGPT